MPCPRYEFSTRRVYSSSQAKYSKQRSGSGQIAGVAMKSRLATAFFLTLFACAVTRPLFAHHSSAGYDVEHPVNLKGVVNNMEWTNPHVFIYLDVKDDNGNVEQWRVEGNSPNMLVRAGWRREMIKAGDQLVVSGASAKSGSKVMRLISLTLANGQKYDGQGFK